MLFSEKSELEILLETKKALVGIIGLGYVGLPLTLMYLKKGYSILGLDSDDNKIKLLSEGKSYINYISNSDIEQAKLTDRINYSNDMSLLRKCDVILICVPTPLSKDKKIPDLSFIQEVVEQLIIFSRPNQLVILESSTCPGTTRNEIEKKLACRVDLKVGKNYFIAYSPERIDPNNQDFKIEEIPKVIGGITEECLKYAVKFYSSVMKNVYPVSSPEIAETAKLLENTYRFINVAFINEMASQCRLLNIDIWEVIEASATKPFGFQKFYPGPGVGGHCIPIDPIYFKWVANRNNLDTEVIDLAIKINGEVQGYIIQKVKELITRSEENILIIGVAYKKNVNDYRESSALIILRELLFSGYNLDYYDPFIPEIQLKECDLYKQSISFNKATLEKYDVIIIHTAHDKIDYTLLESTRATIIDTTNVIRKKEIKYDKVVSL